MNDHTPPPPRLLVRRTTTEILKETTTIFSTSHHLLVFLLLSFLLLSLRAFVETATRSLIFFIDNDPSINSVFSRTQLPPTPPSTTTTTHQHHNNNRHSHPRGPFLQLTRIGTLHDDFFSGDDEIDHRFFGTVRKPQLNATTFILDSSLPQFGSSNFVSDNGIRVSEIIRSSAKMSFRSIEIIEKGINDSAPIHDETTETKTVLQFFLKRFDPQHHDFTTILFLFAAISASYWFMALLCVAHHAWVHGVIFVLVVNDFLNGYNSFLNTFFHGASSGFSRLCKFIVMRWMVMDNWTQIQSLWFFGVNEDQNSILKMFARMKLMPFSTVSPWINGFEKEIYGFMLTWFLLDMIVSFVLTVVAWVVMVDPRKFGKEGLKEGCYLLSLLIQPAIILKCLESVVCGPVARWLLTRFFGKLFALAIQSFMEVYFLVAWLVYYFSVRSIDANSSGVSFGRRELEAMLEDVR